MIIPGGMGKPDYDWRAELQKQIEALSNGGSSTGVGSAGSWGDERQRIVDAQTNALTTGRQGVTDARTGNRALIERLFGSVAGTPEQQAAEARMRGSTTGAIDALWGRARTPLSAQMEPIARGARTAAMKEAGFAREDLASRMGGDTSSPAYASAAAAAEGAAAGGVGSGLAGMEYQAGKDRESLLGSLAELSSGAFDSFSRSRQADARLYRDIGQMQNTFDLSAMDAETRMALEESANALGLGNLGLEWGKAEQDGGAQNLTAMLAMMQMAMNGERMDMERDQIPFNQRLAAAQLAADAPNVFATDPNPASWHTSLSNLLKQLGGGEGPSPMRVWSFPGGARY